MVGNGRILRRAALLSVVIALLLPAFAMAADAVKDEAGLFTTAEISQIRELIGEIRETYQMDAAVLTTRKVPKNRTGESMEETQDYADEYYDRNGFGMGEDGAGILYLIDINNRVLYLSTKGIMIDYISDSRREKLLDAAYEEAGRGNYGQSAIAVLTRLKEILDKGIEEGHFRYDEATGERITGLYNRLTKGEIIFAGVAGFAVIAVIYLSVAAKYGLKRTTYRFDRDTQSSKELRRDDKIFLRQTVTRTRIPRNTGSGGSGGGHGGGSGVHFSSGGGMHGGGGRHF